MENTIYINFENIYFSCKIGEIVAFVILVLYLIINISGIIEIERKKYPTKVFYIVIPLMTMQTLSLLGSEGNLEYPFSNECFSDLTFYVSIVAYYVGYFICGIISTIILFVCINHYDKVAKKNE